MNCTDFATQVARPAAGARPCSYGSALGTGRAWQMLTIEHTDANATKRPTRRLGIAAT